MSHYFIANIKIKDLKEYQFYIKEADKVFKKYNGEYLVVDNMPEILEGEWDYTRAVIIKFPGKADFKEWYNSEGYQRILKYRLSAAECDTILARGLEEERKN